MIAYEVPTLYCECGHALCRDDIAGIRGRFAYFIYRCLNRECRHYNKPAAFKPIEHRLEE